MVLQEPILKQRLQDTSFLHHKSDEYQRQLNHLQVFPKIILVKSVVMKFLLPLKS